MSQIRALRLLLGVAAEPMTVVERPAKQTLRNHLLYDLRMRDKISRSTWYTGFTETHATVYSKSWRMSILLKTASNCKSPKIASTTPKLLCILRTSVSICVRHEPQADDSEQDRCIPVTCEISMT